jgi:hypothetical protein
VRHAQLRIIRSHLPPTREGWLASPARLDRLIEEYGGACAVCNVRPSEPDRDLLIDVVANGAVRGVLCLPCYFVVRLVGEDEPMKRLLTVARYMAGELTI